MPETHPPSTSEKLPICVFLPVKNEEEHLPAVLETVKDFARVVVLDSMSTDRTVEIARQYGCEVVQRAFDDWATHLNSFFDSYEFEQPWVFYLDADERMTPQTQAEVAAIVAKGEDAEHEAYFCGRTNYLFGKPLKHAMSAGYVMRFFRPEAVRFARRVNQQPVLREPAGYLKSRFVHHHFSRGFSQWFEKHNQYATWEAQEWLDAVAQSPVSFGDLFSGDGNTRIQAMKRISFHLPFRPALKFGFMYFWRLGILDGRAGFHCCMLMGVFEYMIGLKVREMKRRRAGLEI